MRSCPLLCLSGEPPWYWDDKSLCCHIMKHLRTAVVVHESRTHFAYPIMHIYSVCVFGCICVNKLQCLWSSNINKTKLKSQELNFKYEAKHWGLQEYLRICEYNVSVSILSVLGRSVGFVVPCGASRWQRVTGCGSCDPWICRTCKGKRWQLEGQGPTQFPRWNWRHQMWMI